TQATLSCIRPVTKTKRNLPQVLRLALTSLKSNPNIIIKKSDKGGNVVVLDRDMYVIALDNMLDPAHYKRVSEDLTTKILDEVLDWARYNFRTKQIDKQTLRYLSEHKLVTPQFYGLPKAHKQPPFPFRPIIAGSSSATIRACTYIDTYLTPTTLMQEYFVRDTKDL
uniref:Reverse transcriptase domain-containing protein n=1 Tax=Latimeria chalumnae TaxID=7897 RepID=H2ZUW5_LATCH